MGFDGFGIHQPTLERIAADLVAARRLGVAIAVVVGGGNIVRGVKISATGIPRVTGDMMGILATVMNALALETAIEKAGIAARTMSALAMPEICETYERRRPGSAISTRGGCSCSRRAPAIPSSRPTLRPSCGRPKSVPMRCSRPPT